MRGERERKKSSKKGHFFLSIIMDGRQLKILTYPRRGILVEGGGTLEHRLHIRNAACVEVRYISSEGSGTVEHISHIYNASCVKGRYVTIEGFGKGEHIPHTRNAAGIKAR